MNYIKSVIKQLIPFSVKLGMVCFAILLLAWIGGAILFTSASNNLIAKSQQLMSVSGSAKKKVSPDSARITLGKVLRGKSAAELQSQAGTAVNTLSEKLQTLGVKPEEIRTSNYSVNPTYDKNGDLSGYEVNVAVEITLEKQNPEQKLLGQIVAAGSESGIDVVNNLSFYLSDYDQQVKDLQTDAIADARTNAERQARAAGANLGKVINVSSGGYYPYYGANGISAPTAAADSSAGSSSAVKFSSGQFDLESSVTVTYELY